MVQFVDQLLILFSFPFFLFFYFFIFLKKMPLPSLPDECFSGILSYLDRESLYQCLFVNRYYCKFSIPVIWRDPFIAPTSEKLSLINTLLSCLNEDEISSLIPCAINFNNSQFP